LVVVAWNDFVETMIKVGVEVVTLVRVTTSVEGDSVSVFPLTPSCWQAVE
jgi:hypothetical protein